MRGPVQCLPVIDGKLALQESLCLVEQKEIAWVDGFSVLHVDDHQRRVEVDKAQQREPEHAAERSHRPLRSTDDRSQPMAWEPRRAAPRIGDHQIVSSTANLADGATELAGS